MTITPRAVAAYLAWFVVLLVSYLMLITAITPAETVVGALLAASGAVVALLCGRAFGVPHLPPAWVWRALGRLPGSICRDTARLCWMLLPALVGRAGPVGTTAIVSLPRVRVDERVGQRGYAVLLLSTSPGTIAIDIEPAEDSRGSDRVRVHETSRGAASRTVPK